MITQNVFLILRDGDVKLIRDVLAKCTVADHAPDEVKRQSVEWQHWIICQLNNALVNHHQLLQE